jgi:hypothetical protein
MLLICRYSQIASKLAPTQFAARQRGVWTAGELSSNNPHIIDFVGYYVYVGGALAAKACTAQLRG